MSLSLRHSCKGVTVAKLGSLCGCIRRGQGFQVGIKVFFVRQDTLSTDDMTREVKQSLSEVTLIIQQQTSLFQFQQDGTDVTVMLIGSDTIDNDVLNARYTLQDGSHQFLEGRWIRHQAMGDPTKSEEPFMCNEGCNGSTVLM